jgi:transcriptional regulator with XRE-family HTH domain
MERVTDPAVPLHVLVRRARRRRGWRQADLAEALGISSRQVMRLESGDNLPSEETLTKLRGLFPEERWPEETDDLSRATDERVERLRIRNRELLRQIEELEAAIDGLLPPEE